MRKNKIIIFILAVIFFAAGVYFRNDVVNFYNFTKQQINKTVNDFQKTDIGALVLEAGKEVFAPPPLEIRGDKSDVVLSKSKVISETNFQRQQNGMSALIENEKLDKAALAKANDMFNNQYFEHVSPSGVGPGKLAQSYGYDYIVAGENLILGNFSGEKEVVDGWMASPGHRANILNERYTEIGVAMIKGTYKGEIVWIGVQEFGLPLSACSPLDANLKNQINSDKVELESLVLQIDQKRSEINNTNSRSASYNKMIDSYNQLVAQYNSLAEELKGFIATYNNQVNIFNNCVAGK